MENIGRDIRPAFEWTPPRTRQEADEAILSLSNDVGLILAQLAEDQVAWSQRTGRSALDYAAWRRRALFAKVHKEGQLRECKRIRAYLATENAPLRVATGLELVVARSRAVVEAWLDFGGRLGDGGLDQALTALAEALDTADAGGLDVNLAGMRAVAPRLVEAAQD